VQRREEKECRESPVIEEERHGKFDLLEVLHRACVKRTQEIGRGGRGDLPRY
jgi:hypothetical protein